MRSFFRRLSTSSNLPNASALADAADPGRPPAATEEVDDAAGMRDTTGEQATEVPGMQDLEREQEEEDAEAAALLRFYGLEPEAPENAPKTTAHAAGDESADTLGGAAGGAGTASGGEDGELERAGGTLSVDSVKMPADLEAALAVEASLGASSVASSSSSTSTSSSSTPATPSGQHGRPAFQQQAGPLAHAAAAAVWSESGGPGLPSLDLVLANPDAFASFLGFASTATQREVLFVCEMDQLLESYRRLSPQDLAVQLERVFHVYLYSKGPSPIAKVGPATDRLLLTFRPGVAFEPELFRAGRDEVKTHIATGALRAYWRYLAGPGRRVAAHVLANLGPDAPTSTHYQFSDVLRDPAAFRALFLYLLAERRHRPLLLWYDLTRAGVHRLDESRFRTSTARKGTAGHQGSHYLAKRRQLLVVLRDIHAKYVGPCRLISHTPGSERPAEPSVTGLEPVLRPSSFWTSGAGAGKAAQDGPAKAALDDEVVSTVSGVGSSSGRPVSRSPSPPRISERATSQRQLALRAAVRNVHSEICKLLSRLRPLHARLERLPVLQYWPQLVKSKRYHVLHQTRVDARFELLMSTPAAKAAAAGPGRGGLAAVRLGAEDRRRHSELLPSSASASPLGKAGAATAVAAAAARQSPRPPSGPPARGSVSVGPAAGGALASSATGGDLRPASAGGAPPKAANLVAALKLDLGGTDYVVTGCVRQRPAPAGRAGRVHISSLVQGMLVLRGEPNAAGGGSPPAGQMRVLDYNVEEIVSASTPPDSSKRGASAGGDGFQIPYGLANFCFLLASGSVGARDPYEVEPEGELIGVNPIGSSAGPQVHLASWGEEKLNPMVEEFWDDAAAGSFGAPFPPSPTRAATAAPSAAPFAATSSHGSFGSLDSVPAFALPGAGADDGSPPLPRDRLYPFVLSAAGDERTYGHCLQIFVRERPTSSAASGGNAAGAAESAPVAVCYSICLVSVRPVHALMRGCLTRLWADLRRGLVGHAQKQQAASGPAALLLLDRAAFVDSLRGAPPLAWAVRLLQPLPDGPSEAAVASGFFADYALGPGPAGAAALPMDRSLRPDAWGGWTVRTNPNDKGPRDPGPGPGVEAFAELFRVMQPARVLLLLESLMLEKKVLLVSSRPALLTLAAECASCLLYPFEWTYPFVPVLPGAMLDYLQCPTPFLIGVHSSHAAKALALSREGGSGAGSADSNLVVVNVDDDEVLLGGGALRSLLPAEWRRSLTQHIRRLFGGSAVAPVVVSAQLAASASVPVSLAAGGLSLSPAAAAAAAATAVVDGGAGAAGAPVLALSDAEVLPPDAVLRLLLVRTWIDMMQSWRHYCTFLADDRDPALLFDTPSFIESRPQPWVPFVTAFLRARAFTVFLYQRSDAGVGLRPVYATVSSARVSDGLIFALAAKAGAAPDAERESVGGPLTSSRSRPLELVAGRGNSLAAPPAKPMAPASFSGPFLSQRSAPAPATSTAQDGGGGGGRNGAGANPPAHPVGNGTPATAPPDASSVEVEPLRSTFDLYELASEGTDTGPVSREHPLQYVPGGVRLAREVWSAQRMLTFEEGQRVLEETTGVAFGGAVVQWAADPNSPPGAAAEGGGDGKLGASASMEL